MTLKCCDPFAVYVPCIICGCLVKTCERKDRDENGDCICPVHPNGSELRDGNWVCSSYCYDIAIGDLII